MRGEGRSRPKEEHRHGSECKLPIKSGYSASDDSEMRVQYGAEVISDDYLRGRDVGDWASTPVGRSG